MTKKTLNVRGRPAQSPPAAKGIRTQSTANCANAGHRPAMRLRSTLNLQSY